MLINKHCHGINHDLVGEIETEYALEAINEQCENQVIIPATVTQAESRSTVALMVADDIDNLECKKSTQ